MSGTRDQVQAHGFAVRRQSLALLRGPDGGDDPRRRTSRAVAGGVVVTVLALAVTGVVGLLTHRGRIGAIPRDGVIVDASTRGAYVLVGGVLHPTLNLVSAELLAGHRITTLPTSALRRLPRGRPVGIPGAPDALPPPNALSRGRWTACSVGPRARGASPRLTVSIGAAGPTPLTTATGVVATAGGVSYLLEDGVRYRLTPAAVTLLGLDQWTPVDLTPAVLDLVPAGPDLEVPHLVGAGGAPTARLPFRATVGDLVRTASDDIHPDVGRYVVLAGGLAPVDAVTYALLAGAAPATHTVAARTVAAVPTVARPVSLPASWPRSITAPAPYRDDAPLCVTYDPTAPHTTTAAWTVTLSRPPAPPIAPDAVPGAGDPGVALPGGGGVLARAVSGGGVDGVWVLVTDAGVAYPVADSDTVARLGYPTRPPVQVPLPFLNLLPRGPALDPAAAGAEYAPATAVPSRSAPATAVPSASAPATAAPTGSPRGAGAPG